MEFSKLSVTVYQINSTELNGMNSNAQLRRYTWNAPASGLDTPLAMYNVADTTTSYYRVGANKNILALTSGKSIVAQYEYSPFGATISQTGDMAAVNPFRFSNKYFDDETGLIYYNYRYYNPTLGRWLSRDPIGENGGENLYVFVTNNSIGNVDILGLRCCSEAQKQHCLDGLRDAWRKTKDAWDDFTRYDPVLDGIGGFPKHGGGTTKPKGHYIELTARFNGIKNSLEQFAECADCDNFNSPPKYPKKLDNWVNRPLPKPVTPNEPMPIIPTIPIPKTPPTPTIPVIDTILNFFDSLPIMGPIMILPNPEIFMPDFGSSYHGGGFA